MAHKTFISYKYSERTALRDKIVTKLGSDATYYQGETSFSPDMGDLKTTTIRQKLSDMIFDTTVMIVLVSPNMTQSAWMNWEIKYALREQSRNGRVSHSNGLICVVQKDLYSSIFGFDPYNWAKTAGSWSSAKFFGVLIRNMNNKKPWPESPIPTDNRKLYDELSPNYIDIVTEDDFLMYPTYYINKAFEKNQNISTYYLAKE
ncbi:MAG: TIR domain-containing protein [Clostridiaceae bacterium]